MKKFRALLKRRAFELLVIVLILTVAALAIAPSVLKFIPSGKVGVLYRTFGNGTDTDLNNLHSEGMNFILPWDELIEYDTRIQEKSISIHALTREGLSIQVELSVRYHLNVRTIGLLHKYIGPDYLETVIIPEIEATARDVIGIIDVDSLYSHGRVAIQDTINNRALKKINMNSSIMNEHTDSDSLSSTDFNQDGVSSEVFIIFENLFLRDIILPDGLEKKIEQKMVAEQELRRYQYLLASEEEEKKRKMIEASGIKAFEDSSGISILKWRGLHATEVLSHSPNSKLIVIGTDENLPIILNGEESK